MLRLLRPPDPNMGIHVTPSDPWLSAEAVAHMTGTKRRRLQCERLKAMGVPFRTNWIGCPLVEAARVLTVVPIRGHAAPDWGKVRRGQAAKTQPASTAAHDDAPGRVLPFGASRG